MNTIPTREELIGLIKDLDTLFEFERQEVWKELNKALDRIYTSDWIKIQDGCEMPETDFNHTSATLLIYNKDGEINLGFYNSFWNRFWAHKKDDIYSITHPTHWRYATPPPTE